MARRNFPEHKINRQFWQYLNLCCPNVLAFHPCNEGQRTPWEAERLTEIGLVPGVADLVLVHNGKAFFVEAKAPGGKLSPAQERFAEDVRAAGAEFAVCYDLDDLKNALTAWSIPTREAR